MNNKSNNKNWNQRYLDNEKQVLIELDRLEREKKVINGKIRNCLKVLELIECNCYN